MNLVCQFLLFMRIQLSAQLEAMIKRNNSSVSNWLNSWFNDNFLDTDLMPHMNATAPGLKKDMVKMNMDKDSY